MNKLLITVTSAMAVATVSATPALSDASSTKGAATLPLRALSFIAGSVVGTPVAIVRYIGRDEREMIQEFKGSTPSWKLFGLPEGLFPIAFVQGMCQGVYHGPKNAIANPPFGKEAFSLGDLPENTPETDKQ